MVPGSQERAPAGKRRHEFQADHGFRKYFNTICDKHMKTLFVEFLMGHNTGLKESYNRTPQDELLSGYPERPCLISRSLNSLRSRAMKVLMN